MGVKRKNNYIRIASLLLWVIGTIKILFVGYDIDEQYALVMSYRMTQGDFPIYNMWEPHQTSGFLMAFFMLPYLLITGGTIGIALYVRVCGLLCHLIVHIFLYRTLCKYLDADHSLFVCGISFFVLPKLMFLPDFANIQIWFLMLLCICLLRYYGMEHLATNRGNRIYLILSGLFTALEVLTYPSTIFVFVIVVFLVIRFREEKDFVKELLAYILPCVVSAVIFLGIMVMKIPVSDFPFLLERIMSDGSHSTTVSEWIARQAVSLLKCFALMAIYAAMATILYYIIDKKSRGTQIMLLWQKLWVATALIGQMMIWIFGGQYPNFPSIEYLMLPVLVIGWICRKRIRKSPVFAFLVVVPFMAFQGVLLFSNHPLMASLPFLGSCVVGILALPEMKEVYEKEKNEKSNVFFSLKVMLFLWFVIIVFGKCYMIRMSQGVHYTVFDEMSLSRHGVVKGLVVDTAGAERNRDVSNLVKDVLPCGVNVFYVGRYPDIYMQQDVNICTPSTISTPTYDENMDMYFQMYPEKEPEYIIIDAGYVDLQGNDWVRAYLETNCEENPMAENIYVRIYKRK